MLVREVRIEERHQFNQAVPHPLQSWEWGEFRQLTGVEVIRLGLFDQTKLLQGYQLTLHPLPNLPYTVGYLPKGWLPSQEVLQAFKDLARQKQILFIKLEPNIVRIAQPTSVAPSQDSFFNQRQYLFENDCVFGKPLFTKYNFWLDLRSSEEQLLSLMKQKTRYNVGVAQRKGVIVVEDNSDQAFDDYLHLTFDVTTKRQKFYAHNREYHQKMWRTLQPAGIAHLFKAVYDGHTLVTWIVFTFNQVLYYPYGASSNEYREVMASNLMMWEAIRYGKAQGCHTFDMWGSLGPDADSKDPWYGFHHFKEGFGPTLMESLGTYDLVADRPKYQIYTALDKLRWAWLRFRANLPV